LQLDKNGGSGCKENRRKQRWERKENFSKGPRRREKELDPSGLTTIMEISCRKGKGRAKQPKFVFVVLKKS